MTEMIDVDSAECRSCLYCVFGKGGLICRAPWDRAALSPRIAPSENAMPCPHRRPSPDDA